MLALMHRRDARDAMRHAVGDAFAHYDIRAIDAMPDAAPLAVFASTPLSLLSPLAIIMDAIS